MTCAIPRPSSGPAFCVVSVNSATPATLGAISLGRIDQGGYGISYSAQLPPTGYKVFLALQTDTSLLDLTSRSAKGVVGTDNLPDFLDLIDAANLWGKSAECRIVVKRDGRLVSRSDPKTLQCPVAPYTHGLGTDLLNEENVKDFTYSGIKDGCYFNMPAIDGFTLLRLSEFWKIFFNGLAIVVAVTIDALVTRRLQEALRRRRAGLLVAPGAGADA